MERIQRSLKIRIYPTQTQQEFLDKTLGSCRFIYNQMLGERIARYEEYKEDKTKLYGMKYTTEKEWKEKFAFLKEVDSFALQQARRNLETAYGNFYKSLKGLRKGEKVGFPQFKSKHSHTDSYRTAQTVKCNFELQEIRVPKCDSLKFKGFRSVKSWYRLDETEVKNITISKSASGKYFASILFEGNKDFSGVKKEIKTVKGLDMSLPNFYEDDQGNNPEYRKNYRENEERLAILQQKLALKIKGSKNREKARIKVARLHEKIANKRRDFNHKLSHKLIQENDCIVVENLNLKGMMKNHCLAKAVADLGYGSFVSMLQYKAEWNDKTIVLADRWFASSKICNVCGTKKKDLLLQEREWTCEKCETHHYRDQNAAINLKNLVSNSPQELRVEPCQNAVLIAAE